MSDLFPNHEELIIVGVQNPKYVSKLNHEIFTEIQTRMDESSAHLNTCGHIGWYDLGLAIDWLEENYNITKKV